MALSLPSRCAYSSAAHLAFPFPPVTADPHRRPSQFYFSAEIPQGGRGHATYEEVKAHPPAIHTRASQVQCVYDSGRRKVRAATFFKTKKNARVFLITSLVWLCRQKRSCRISDGWIVVGTSNGTKPSSRLGVAFLVGCVPRCALSSYPHL
jgi:hypothetical protein